MFCLHFSIILIFLLPSGSQGFTTTLMSKVDTNILSVLSNFQQMKQDKCLFILLGHWTIAQTNLVQQSFPNSFGILHGDEGMPSQPDQSAAELFCQVAIFREEKFIEKADKLCKFNLKSKCVSIYLFDHKKDATVDDENSLANAVTSGNKETPVFEVTLADLTVAVIKVAVQSSPLDSNQVQTFYSLWFPSCRKLYKNVFILRGKRLFQNQVFIIYLLPTIILMSF